MRQHCRSFIRLVAVLALCLPVSIFAQVSPPGIVPYLFNGTTSVSVFNTSTAGQAVNFPPPGYAMYGYNTGSSAWFPCTTSGSCFGGSGGGSGTVTNFTFPTALGSLFACTTTNPTTTPTVACAVSSAAQNTVYAGPASGGMGTPSFRALAASDIAGAGTLSNNTLGNAATASTLVATQSTLASAATVDLGTASTANVAVSGTTMVTSFGSTAPVGSTYTVTFSGAAPVQASANLVLPVSYGYIWPAVGDSLTCSVPVTAGSWVCTNYSSVVARSPDGQLVNVTPSSLLNIRAKIAGVRAGLNRATVLFETDSTGTGTGCSTGTDGLVGAWICSFANAFKAMASTSNVPVNSQSFFGEQCVSSVAGVPYNSYDPRVTLGGSWATAVASMGGQMFYWAAGGTVGALSFNPGQAIDTLVVPYITNGFGSFVAAYNGNTLGTINETGLSGYHLQKYTLGSAQTGTYTATPSNNGAIYTAGVITYNSAIPAVDLIQGGCFGAVTASYTPSTAPWDPQNVIQVLAPDLTIIDLTINDSNIPTAIATYVANMQTLITKAKASGSVLLMVGPPSNSTLATNGTLDSYVAALANLAATNNVALVNTKARWTSYAVTNPVMPYFDNLHPEKAGYQDIAKMILNALNVAF